MSPLRLIRWRVFLLLCGGLLLLTAPSPAAPATQIKALLQQAEFFERQGDWDRACDVYEAVLRLQRNAPEVRARYQQCLRRFWQNRRHRDIGYRSEVLSLEYGKALKLYNIIRDTLLDHAVEKRKLDAGKLFRKGLEEFEAALGDPTFCQQYLPAISPDAVQAFRAMMKQTWAEIKPMSRQEAMHQLKLLAADAWRDLQLDKTVVVMEFACGACYALDEYTVYLTPNQLSELCHTLKGETVGVGLTLVLQEGRIVIHDVAPDGPAAQLVPPLEKGNQILSIDRKAIGPLPLETIREQLEGPAGSSVVVEVQTPLGPRTVTLRRRAQFVPSVAYYMKTPNVAYLQIAAFHETTAQEVDAALAALSQANMKALILDLRGNTGGLFDTAIDVARRFLSSGVIASTRHADSKLEMIYQARNPQALTLPLIVLVDGDTASAAEVLAGALKENQRARLIGQTTFGKGCTQCVLKLPAATGGSPTGGLRLTVARFYSPKGEPYSGRGILPDLVVERALPEESLMVNFDQQLLAAVNELERQFRMPPARPHRLTQCRHCASNTGPSTHTRL